MTDIPIVQGEDRTLKLTVRDPAAGDPPPVKDISGGLISFTARLKAKEPGAALILKTSATPSEAVLVDPTNGRADIFILPADTESVPPGQYVYDIWFTDSTGKEFAVLRISRFIVIERVTIL